MDRFQILKGLLPSPLPGRCQYLKPVDIEIFGQEYQGRLSNMDSERACVVFWAGSNERPEVEIEYWKSLINQEIHFHFHHNVFYMLVETMEIMAENPYQIILNGTLR
jgi:hypothetical protein